MATLASIVAVAALIGAAASWAYGAWSFVCTLRALSGESKSSQVLYAMVAWPFVSRQATGEAAVHATRVNKSLVAFIACVMIAATAISLSTNLSRLSR
jgi:hypothetical protein